MCVFEPVWFRENPPQKFAQSNFVAFIFKVTVIYRYTVMCKWTQLHSKSIGTNFSEIWAF